MFLKVDDHQILQVESRPLTCVYYYYYCCPYVAQHIFISMRFTEITLIINIQFTCHILNSKQFTVRSGQVDYTLYLGSWISLVTNTHDCISQHWSLYFITLDMKGCICPFLKWQIHPFIPKGTICFITLCTQQTRDIYPMLAHRLRRWPNIGQMSRVCWVATQLSVHLGSHHNR